MGKAWIDGAPAPFAEAVSAAAHRLASSRLPLVTGLATDVAGVRAAVRLATVAGGVLDHSRSAALYRNLDVLRRVGLFRGVPAELRRRCDRVLLVGADAAEAAPGVLGFLLAGAPDLGRAAGDERRTVWLGASDDAALTGVALDAVPMPADAIAGFVGMIRASLAGRRFDARASGAERATEIAAWLSQAKFAAIVWSARSLDTIAIETLAGLVTDLNAVTRASAVPLGEAGEAQGAAEASTWLAGYPLRVSFSRGETAHDPQLFAADRLLSAGECDLVVLVDARDGVSLDPPAAGAAPVIRIAAGPEPKGAPAAAIAFEVASAGGGSGGALWDERLASFVSHPAGDDRTAASSAADVLHAIAEALEPLNLAGRAA